MMEEKWENELFPLWESPKVCSHFHKLNGRGGKEWLAYLNRETFRKSRIQKHLYFLVTVPSVSPSLVPNLTI